MPRTKVILPLLDLRKNFGEEKRVVGMDLLQLIISGLNPRNKNNLRENFLARFFVSSVTSCKNKKRKPDHASDVYTWKI
jgi:hypothetical protein